MSGTPFPSLLSFFLPITQSLVRMDGVGWRHNQIFRHRQVWKRNQLQKPRATILHVFRFTEEGRYGQPKYCWEKAIYAVMISFALDFFLFFWSIGFKFLYVWGSAARALRARTLCWKEGNQARIRNIFVNSKIRANRSFSVWSPIWKEIYKTFLTVSYIFTNDKWIKDWIFP